MPPHTCTITIVNASDEDGNYAESSPEDPKFEPLPAGHSTTITCTADRGPYDIYFCSVSPLLATTVTFSGTTTLVTVRLPSQFAVDVK